MNNENKDSQTQNKEVYVCIQLADKVSIDCLFAFVKAQLFILAYQHLYPGFNNFYSFLVTK